TGDIVLDTDAVEVDGKWYKKSILNQLISGEPVEVINTTAEIAQEEPDDDYDYDDIDLDEDF
ncbi:MAG: hypothetical protein U9R21_08015, partial [Candidatus Thermoplasmatota archaeon]|nr:hypothetical protein [Candidatus Thermoplasmatota archaeon]